MEDLISKFGLTLICIILMAGWAWQAFPKFKRSVKENPFGDFEQPNTASVLGVLGTFIGIAWGLFNFNPSPEAMHNSVTNLLGGMTTAFFTSILGMGITRGISATTNTALSKINDTTNQTIASMKKMSEEISSESFKITSETVSKMEKMMAANDKNFREP
ncbi:MAG: hypothetical protein IJL14_06490 [Selenomonadaceae bacterium]|nr:hypothetical protein [Selenomonadaceae bacterium]